VEFALLMMQIKVSMEMELEEFVEEDWLIIPMHPVRIFYCRNSFDFLHSAPDSLLTSFTFSYFLGTQDPSWIQTIERDILDLKIGRPYHGVSTEAEWAQDLKRQGRLRYEQSFQGDLENTKYS
jgi:hypothetical protein